MSDFDLSDVPKYHFYILYWGMEKSTAEIAAKYDVGESTVQDHLQKHGIPRRKDGCGKRQWILHHRSKQFFYQKYWGEDNTLREMASQLDVNHEMILGIMQSRGIPRDTDTHIRWYDEDRGIPEKYKLPRDERRGTTDSTDEPSGSLPEDPNPTDYLAKTPLHRDKERLYQLYWGYGLSAEAIAARCESDGIHVKENLRKLGIPTRDFHDHLRWEPHHGIPPKYEWADDNDEMDHERGLYLSPKGEQNTTRTVGD